MKLFQMMGFLILMLSSAEAFSQDDWKYYFNIEINLRSNDSSEPEPTEFRVDYHAGPNAYLETLTMYDGEILGYTISGEIPHELTTMAIVGDGFFWLIYINQMSLCYNNSFEINRSEDEYHANVTVSVTPIDPVRIWAKDYSTNECTDKFPSKDTIAICSNYPIPSDVWTYTIPGGGEGGAFPVKEAYGWSSEICFLTTGEGWRSDYVSNVVGKNVILTASKLSCISIPSVILQAMKSAPHIIGTEVEKPTCSYKTDGSITIQFDRDLEDGETVGFVVKKGNDSVYTDRNLDNISKADLDNNRCLTLTNIAEGKYFVKIGSAKMYGYKEYIEGAGHSIDTVTITPPQSVSGTFTPYQVNCYGGNDGRILVNGSGGTGIYHVLNNDIRIPGTFGTEGYTIGRLSPGTYRLKIYDSHGCEARNEQNNETIFTQNIAQPEGPVALAVEKVFQPRGWGLTDGWIKVRAQGGTAPPNGGYRFFWTQGTDTITVLPPEEEGNSMIDTAKNLGDGYYHIRVEDSHYYEAKNLAGVTADDLAGCFAELDTFLVQPPKLEMEIATSDSVSCFGRADGAIVAHARGGVGGPGTYAYEWKRKEESVSVPVSDGFIADSISRDLFKATYTVTVRDMNGITTTVDYFLDEPDLLTAKILSNTLLCDGDADGWIQAQVSGGTAPYRYTWAGFGTERAGEGDVRIEGLSNGAYSVLVKDRRLCEAIAVGRILVPGGMEVDSTVVPPVCHDAADGSIRIAVSGGAGSYRYEWDTGDNTPVLDHIPSGRYSVKVTDANRCFLNLRFTLPNPAPLNVDLGPDATLCRGQAAFLSAAIPDVHAEYRWYNRYGLFSEESGVEISSGGEYRVEVTDGNACRGADTVLVSIRDVEISADFVAAARAACTVPTCLVNISHPAPEFTEWIIPDDASIRIVNRSAEQVELQFNREGRFDIGLRTRVGECEKTVFKTITVVGKYDLTGYEPQQEAFLKQFRLWPNPGNGQFTVSVELSEMADIQLRLVSISGVVTDVRQLSGNNLYEERYALEGKLQPGMYVMQLVSKKAVAAIQVVIN